MTSLNLMVLMQQLLLLRAWLTLRQCRLHYGSCSLHEISLHPGFYHLCQSLSLCFLMTGLLMDLMGGGNQREMPSAAAVEYQSHKCTAPAQCLTLLIQQTIFHLTFSHHRVILLSISRRLRTSTATASTSSSQVLCFSTSSRTKELQADKKMQGILLKRGIKH